MPPRGPAPPGRPCSRVGARPAGSRGRRSSFPSSRSEAALRTLPFGARRPALRGEAGGGEGPRRRPARAAHQGHARHLTRTRPQPARHPTADFGSDRPHYDGASGERTGDRDPRSVQDLQRRQHGFDRLDLGVDQGEVFGFLGPNGAGKSTTIRLLLDLIRPTAGRATLLGRDSRSDGVDVRRRVGYLPATFVSTTA